MATAQCSGPLPAPPPPNAGLKSFLFWDTFLAQLRIQPAHQDASR